MRKFNKMVDIDRLRELLGYNPKTGAFTWKQRRGSAAKGSVAGHQDESGYIQIRIDGRLCLGHRLAWAMQHGEWPQRYIDHINGNKHDNRMSNLRLCSQSQNGANSGPLKNSRSGVRGVYWHKQEGKWHVQLCKNYKKKSYGLYDSLEVAEKVALRAASELHGDFALQTTNK